MLLAGTAILSGCSWGSNTNYSEKTDATASSTANSATGQQYMDYSHADSQTVLNTAINHKPAGQNPTMLNQSGSEGESFQSLSTCIKELNALKTLSPADYNRLVGSFKEVSEINQLYKQVASTASPDTIELLQMAIEAKQKFFARKFVITQSCLPNQHWKKISGL